MKTKVWPKIVRSAVVVLLLATPAFSADKIVQSTWTPAPLRLDGAAADWAGEMMSFDKGSNADYAFRNDGRNLYIYFGFKDPKGLSSMELTGMTVYFGPQGKKQKDVGVRFLKKTITAEQLIEKFEKQGQTLTEERKKELKASPMYVFFDVEAVTKKGEVLPAPPPSAEIDQPAFRAGKQDNVVVFEFRFPLVAREAHPAGVGGAPGQTIRAGFEWGGLTKEMKDAIMSRLGAQGASAVSRDTGMSVDNVSGERSEGDEGAPSPALVMMREEAKKFPKHSFWVDVKLAGAQ